MNMNHLKRGVITLIACICFMIILGNVLTFTGGNTGGNSLSTNEVTVNLNDTVIAEIMIDLFTEKLEEAYNRRDTVTQINIRTDRDTVSYYLTPKILLDEVYSRGQD